MTEPVELEAVVGYPKVQVSSTLHGDLWCFRGESGEDFEETLTSTAKHGDGIFTALAELKQIAIAKGVFSGTATNHSGTSGSGTSNSGVASTSSGPPSNSVPRCAHGAMKDLSNPDGSLKYKKRFYCPAPRGQQQCPAQD